MIQKKHKVLTVFGQFEKLVRKERKKGSWIVLQEYILQRSVVSFGEGNNGGICANKL